MESLTRLVSESLARHGLERPVDYRRLHWSRWFRCESHHSLLSVPSRPGVFAIAEEIMDLAHSGHVATAPWAVPRSEASGSANEASGSANEASGSANEASGSANEKTAAVGCPAEPTLSSSTGQSSAASLASQSETPKLEARMLAVTKFFEDDDMAFTLDRMLSWQNPMRARLESGRYFIRYVVIEDRAQRRTMCTALNQWIASSSQLATGIGAHFATSLELPAKDSHLARGLSPAAVVPQADSGLATDIHCPSLFPSGF